MASNIAIKQVAAHKAIPRARTLRTSCAVQVVARFGGRDSNVMDRPDVEIKKSGWDSDKDMRLPSWLTPSSDDGGSGTDRQKGSPPGGGNYRVILLDSPKHTERAVVKAITTVIPNTDEAQAKNAFATSKQIGMAVVTSCLKEHAEMYCLQLNRHGLKATMEPDNTTA